MKPNKKYKEFVFFSAGPVGDHALVIDYANRFYKSSGISSVVVMKNPNKFIEDLAIPYYDHIRYIKYKGRNKYIGILKLSISSIFIRRCYVLVLPIPPPLYLKVFSFFIRYFTVSRMVALSSPCGYKLKGGPFPSGEFVGEGNFIDGRVSKELFYEQANRMLKFLGYEEVEDVPKIDFIETNILSGLDIKKGEYVVLHLNASHYNRSLPVNRWIKVINSISRHLEGKKLIFSGGKSDADFNRKVIDGLEYKNIIDLSSKGGVAMQDLLNIYANSILNITVHTGNAMLMNMLGSNTLVVNIKGVYMFSYIFNKNAKILSSKDGCTCDPFERDCAYVEYEGGKYMSCLFNIKDEDIINQAIEKLEKNAK